MFSVRLLDFFRRYRWEILPFSLFLSLKFLAFSPFFLENLYGKIIFPNLTKSLRSILGWIPVSVGDLLYSLIICWFIYAITHWMVRKFQNRNHNFPWNRLFKWIGWLLCAYMILWGLQYSRNGLTEKWQLPAFNYGKSELIELNHSLIIRMNTLKSEIVKENKYKHSYSWKANAIKNYQSYSVSKFKGKLPDYFTPSLKSSLYNPWMSAWGISGYYNPITAEAQVNTAYPEFMIPFTACHEVAHQLGIAREQEANLLALVVAENAEDKRLHYSAAFNLYLYAHAQLFQLDSNMARQLNNEINQNVKADFARYRSFVQGNKSITEPVILWIYDQFLIQQGQVRGMNSYQDVVGLWLAYKRKFNLKNQN